MSRRSRANSVRADDPGDGIGCNGMSVLVPMAIGVEAPAVGAPVGAEGLVKIDEGDVVLARQIGRDLVQDERLADICRIRVYCSTTNSSARVRTSSARDVVTVQGPR